jgi:CRISPR-associated protein Cas8b1/Cst1 subtype I-B
MSLSDLFKSNLKDSKPLVKKPITSASSTSAPAPVPMHQLFSINHSEPVADASVNQEQNKYLDNVASLLSLKPSNGQPTKSANVSKVPSDLEQVRTLNAKYIQVINQINEELMKLKTDSLKTTAENASLKKENNDLSNKVSELSNALMNVVQQNKSLSRALGIRS